ncbi:MAG: DUF502 domain-containing protein [Proteobacteria bacterium]|nr:DUF502 domain-containing protein [Pseudomonadota bacterium]
MKKLKKLRKPRTFRFGHLFGRDLLTRLLKNFVKGCLVVAPVAFTLWVVFTLFSFVDNLMLEFEVPGLGAAVTLTVITIVGALASNVAARRFFESAEELLTKFPPLKLLYSSLRDFIGALVGDQERSFDRPVAATLTPDGGAKIMGFVTREDLDTLGLGGHVAVYVPQSYNFAGNLLLFPREQVQALDIDKTKAMAFIVSGGVVSTHGDRRSTTEIARTRAS